MPAKKAHLAFEADLIDDWMDELLNAKVDTSRTINFRRRRILQRCPFGNRLGFLEWRH